MKSNPICCDTMNPWYSDLRGVPTPIVYVNLSSDYT